jgi:MFS family permease
LLLFVRADGLKAAPRRPAAVWHEWLAGLRLVQTCRTPRIIFAFLALTGLGEGVMSTLFVPFATRVLHGTELTYATLISAQAVGGLLGGVVLGHAGGRFAPALMLGGGALLLGAIDLCIFYSPLLTPLLLVPVLLMVLVGVPVAALQAGYLTLAQTSVEDAFRGRLLGLFFATMALSGLIGIAIGGALGDVLGILPLITLQSIVYLAGGGLVLATLGRD